MLNMRIFFAIASFSIGLFSAANAHDYSAQDNLAGLIHLASASTAQTPCLTAVSNANISCTNSQITITSNGLPKHDIMVGIKDGAWNGQWPKAQGYSGSNAFVLPRNPILASTPTLTVKNAAGVAANGVPIFFPHAPGRRGSKDCLNIRQFEGRITDTSCLRDPVAAGEMDICGGHTGRGNDYHYHGTPTCMISKLRRNAVAGYMMDGFPVYAAPLSGSKPYRDCGGYIAPNGQIHYAFTDDFPYVTACLLGNFSEGPRTRGAREYTGRMPRKAGQITGFAMQANGCSKITFSTGRSVSYCP